LAALRTTCDVLSCEDKFVVSAHIAEFWNTLSSLSFCGAHLAVLCLVLRDYHDLRLVILSVTMWALGIGNALLHGVCVRVCLCVCVCVSLSESQ